MSSEAAFNRLWSEQAKTYGWSVDATLSSTLKLQLIHQHVSPTSRVCDIGCANGLYIRAYAASCQSVVGVDINPDMASDCRRMAQREGLRNIEVVEAPAQSIPLPDASFDVICCFSTLQILPDTDDALREMFRLLRPGGTLLVEAQGRLHLGCLFWTVYYRLRGVRLRTFTRYQIAKRLSEHGFSVGTLVGIGASDQWRYIPLVRRARSLMRLFHKSPRPAENLDFALSNTWALKWFASSYFVVAQKNATATPRF